jgi:transposase
MASSPYPCALSDAEWAVLEPLVPPPKPGGRPCRWSRRAILDGIWYVLRGGCAWRLLPRDLPPWQTVYHYFRLWRLDGTWEALNTALRERVRVRGGRKAAPTAAIVDSQSVKTTERGGPHGYDGGKKVNGRKRHLLVDTGGLVLKALVHPADIQDRDGAVPLLAALHDELPSVRRLWADSGYRGRLVSWALDALGLTVEVVQRPDGGFRQRWLPAGAEPPEVPRFQVVPRRWVVERTFAWLGRYRRLSRDYEYRPETSEALVYAAMTRLMTRRLANIPVCPFSDTLY